MKRSKIIKDGLEVIGTELKGIKNLNKTIDSSFDKAVKAEPFLPLDEHFAHH